MLQQSETRSTRLASSKTRHSALLGGLAAAALLSFGAPASAALVPCDVLYLPADEVPFGNYPRLELAPNQTVFVASAGDPVVDVRISPAQDEFGNDVWECGVDYQADLTNGDATLWFGFEGAYYAEVTRASGLTQAAAVLVDAQFRGPGGGGGWTKIPTPSYDLALQSDELRGSADDAWPDEQTTTSADNAVTQICQASEDAGGPVDVVIDAHGASGYVQVGSGGGVGSSNVNDFACDLQGKVSSLCLFSCNVGQSEAFICALERKMGGDVKAFTGTVTNVGDDLYGTGEEVSWEPDPKKKKKVDPKQIDDLNQIDGPDAVIILPLDAIGEGGWTDAVAALLAAWGPVNDHSNWDLNGDDVVDAVDMAALLALVS